MMKRLKEPSTAAGIAVAIVAIGQVMGVHLPEGIVEEGVLGLGAGDWLVTLGALAAAVAAVLRRERGVSGLTVHDVERAADRMERRNSRT